MVFLSVRICARAAIGPRKIMDKLSTPMRGLMPGKNPVIRTKQFLEQGIAFRDSIKIMMINYGDYEHSQMSHEGARKIVSLNFSQFQYKNPDVQILCVKNVTPTPFITFYLENGEKFYVDVEGKSQIEILTHLQKVAGKPKELIAQQTKAIEDNPAYFGQNHNRKCICVCEGQVDCSSSYEVLANEDRIAVCARNRNPNPKKYPFGLEDDA